MTRAQLQVPRPIMRTCMMPWIIIKWLDGPMQDGRCVIIKWSSRPPSNGKIGITGRDNIWRLLSGNQPPCHNLPSYKYTIHNFPILFANYQPFQRQCFLQTYNWSTSDQFCNIIQRGKGLVASTNLNVFCENTNPTRKKTFQNCSRIYKWKIQIQEGRGANGEDMSVMLGRVRKIGTRREVAAVKRRLVRTHDGVCDYHSF